MTKKDKIIAYVKQKGSAKYTEIIKFAYELNGRTFYSRQHRGYWSGAFIPGKGHLVKGGKHWLQKQPGGKNAKYIVVEKNSCNLYDIEAIQKFEPVRTEALIKIEERDAKIASLKILKSSLRSPGISTGNMSEFGVNSYFTQKAVHLTQHELKNMLFNAFCKGWELRAKQLIIDEKTIMREHFNREF